MSSIIKRTLNDLTNENKRLKNDSAIDLNFDNEELNMKNSHSSYSKSISSESLIENDSMFDDDVFEDEQSMTKSLSKINQHQGRKRLNGTSTYRIKENKDKRKSKSLKKDHIIVDQTLNRLLEEQARIDAHSLSIHSKGI
ncbi:unnamed protein product [Adineta steineri]|uniref:Uncharacterized protein n=1 Tax=Adineta steineri TaxID=433720 RepID=A0A813Y7M3_9BILA|nr:unnamed protein product [Adineta steineri]